MEESTGPALSFLLGLVLNPIVVITAFCLGAFGEVVKTIVKADDKSTGWRKAFYVTLPAHAVAVGMLLGLLPWLPPVDGLVKEGYEAVGRFATYTLAGIVCKLCYDSFISTAKRAWNAVGDQILVWLRTRSPIAGTLPVRDSEGEEKP